MAETASELVDLTQALVSYQCSRDTKLRYAEAYVTLGNKYLYKGDFQEARTCYLRALERDPNVAEAQNNLGVAFACQDRYDEAKDAFHKALAMREDFPECLGNLGNVALAHGNLDDAESFYRQSLSLAPESPQGHNNLAVVLARRGEFTFACELLETSLQLAHDYYEALQNLILLYKVLNRPDDIPALLARHELGAAPPPDPTRSQSPKVRTGRTARPVGVKTRGKSGKSGKSTDKSSGNEPKSGGSAGNAAGLGNAESQIHLGQALFLQGHHEDALTCFRRALKIAPNSADAYHSIGLALEELGRVEEAEEAFARAIAINPDLANITRDSDNYDIDPDLTDDAQREIIQLLGTPEAALLAEAAESAKRHQDDQHDQNQTEVEVEVEVDLLADAGTSAESAESAAVSAPSHEHPSATLGHELPAANVKPPNDPEPSAPAPTPDSTNKERDELSRAFSAAAHALINSDDDERDFAQFLAQYELESRQAGKAEAEAEADDVASPLAETESDDAPLAPIPVLPVTEPITEPEPQPPVAETTPPPVETAVERKNARDPGNAAPADKDKDKNKDKDEDIAAIIARSFGAEAARIFLEDDDAMNSDWTSEAKLAAFGNAPGTGTLSGLTSFTKPTQSPSSVPTASAGAKPSPIATPMPMPMPIATPMPLPVSIPVPVTMTAEVAAPQSLDHVIHRIDHEQETYSQLVRRQYSGDGYDQAHGPSDEANGTTSAAGVAVVTSRYVMLVLGDIEMAVPLENVIEIQLPPRITPIPHVPNWILGVTNLRGDIISVVDLRAFFGMDLIPYEQSRRIMVVRSRDGELTTGLIVDRVTGLMTLGSDRILRPSSLVDDQINRFVRGVVSRPSSNRLLVVIDLEELLKSGEMRQFQPF